MKILIETVKREKEEVLKKHILSAWRNDIGKYFVHWYSEKSEKEKIQEVTKATHSRVFDAFFEEGEK